MNLYIETENGQIKNHPAFEENLIAAFGVVPDHWVRFQRVDKPILGVYEVLISEDPTYELVDGVYKDVWRKRDLTSEEITAKQDQVKVFWAQTGFASWVFNETTCSFDPPTPRPDDNGRYCWDETTCSWVAPESTTLQFSSSGGDSVSATATDMIIDLSSNGADSLPGGV